MTGGVAVFDYNNDGRLDIFFTNGARLDDAMSAGKRPDKSDPKFRNRLFRQNSDASFTDVTAEAGLSGTGYSMGAAAADYDNDGFTDLFVTGLDHATLYHNNGDGTFSDVTVKAGVVADGWTTSAGFFDFDNDGHLDLFVARYLKWDYRACGPPGARLYCHPKLFPAVTSLLFRNTGHGTFTDVSKPSGISSLRGKGLGVAFADYDGDGFSDVYVANDSMESFLLHNNGDGTFTEKGVVAGVALNDDGNAFAGMGVEFSDYNNDGLPDLVVTDLATERYMLFRNDGKGQFTNVTGTSGLGRASASYSGWGVKWIDADNDGWKDLFVAQGDINNLMSPGSARRYREKPLLLKGGGGMLTAWPGNPGLVFGSEWLGRGVASGDFDNDGGMDIVVANLGERPHLLHNNSARGNHWIGIKLRGTRSNRDGIGSRVKVISSSGASQYFTVNTAGSYLSSSDSRVLAGLGASEIAKRIEVRWPNGLVQLSENVKANQWIEIVEPAR